MLDLASLGSYLSQTTAWISGPAGQVLILEKRSRRNAVLLKINKTGSRIKSAFCSSYCVYQFNLFSSILASKNQKCIFQKE